MKKITTKMLYVLFAIFIALASCEKEEDNNNNNPNPSDYQFEVGSAKSADFFGTIIDENHQVMAGVNIQIGSSVATTDANGVFFIENAAVFENHAYISAEKPGYFLGSRSIVPQDGVNNVKIMLLEKEVIGSFDASTGGSISGNGLQINFQAGVVDAQGNPYTGNVSVAAQYIDPEHDDFFDYMPGNLIGANEEGGQYLKSLGMAAVELSDDSGNELQLAEGSDAEISFPLSAGLLAGAPSTIPLWHFDEDLGYWSLEGEAVLSGNAYVASVSHFSFWNCDIPTQYVIIDGQAEFGGNPLPNIIVKVVSQNFGTRQDITDNLGDFGGIVPANEMLTLEYYQDCSGSLILIHSQIVGPFSTDQSLGSISLSMGSLVNVTGTLVDCNYNAVQNGYVNINGVSQYVQNGMFNIAVCANTSLAVQGFDLDNLTESGLATYNSGGVANLNLGQIIACNALSEYIIWDIDGVDYVSTTGFYFYDQGGYAGLSGSNPDYFELSLSGFSGVGTYNLNLGTGDWISCSGINGYLESIGTNVVINITQYGANPGDLIEANLSGTLSVNDSISITNHSISSNIHFFKD